MEKILIIRQFCRWLMTLLISIGFGLSADAQNCTVVVIDYFDIGVSQQGFMCDADPPKDLFQYVNTLGGTFTGPGVVGNVFYPSLANLGGNTIVYTLGADSCESNIIIDGTSQQAQIDPLPSNLICIDAAPFQVTASPAPATGVDFVIYLNSADTELEDQLYIPAQQGIGTDNLIYSWLDFTTGCVSWDTVSVTIVESPAAPTFITSELDYCLTEGILDLEADPLGGSFTGVAGISGSQLDLQQAGVGTHTITYSVEDDTGTCASSTELTITINAGQSPGLESVNSVCESFPDTIRLVDIVLDPAANVEWTISDGAEIVGNSADSILIVRWTFPGEYSLTLAIESDDCLNTSGVELLVPARTESICDNVLYIPNVFTPNGDNRNDVLQIHYQNVLVYRMRIYDRWGGLVYESIDPDEQWDGNTNGNDLNSGVFYYTAEGSFVDGSPLRAQGDITLIR